jgi:hypothetical protein
LSALFAIDFGFAGVTRVSTTPIAGIDNGTIGNSLIEQLQYYRQHPRCRSVRICRHTT